MIGLAQICAAAALTLPVPPHAFDKPIADVTVELRAEGVRLGLLMNFQFLDMALGLRGDPSRVPTAEEVAAVRTRLAHLFVSRPVLRIGGAAQRPVLSGFQFAPPSPALQAREPQLTRKVAQLRFHLDYQTATSPLTLELTWHWFPEHARYDVEDSPVAAMTVPVVVLHGERAPQVRQLRVNARSCELSWGGIATATESPRVAASPLLLLGVLLGIVLWSARRRPVLATLGLALFVGSCGAEAAPKAQVQTTETPNYEVRMIIRSAPVLTNRHFQVEVEVRSRTGRALPARVQIDADMPEHGHGMNTRPRLTHFGKGRVRVEGMLFHMPGYWELYVYLGKGQQMERAVFPIRL